MKNVCIVIAVCLLHLLVSEVHGQNAYYDAVQLRSLIAYDSVEGGYKHYKKSVDIDKFTAFYEIMNRYVPAHVGNSTTEVRNHLRDSNSFVKPYLRTGNWASPGEPQGALSGKKLISAIGNMDVTAFADGVAQFLVERAKEELNVAFFDRFNKFLNNYPEFRILFPNTRLFIDNLNAWEYANALNTLREAFDKDVKTILANMTNLSNLDAVRDCPGNNNSGVIAAGDSTECQRRAVVLRRAFGTDAGHIIFSGLYIGHGLTDDQKLPDVIDTLANNSSFMGGYNDENVRNAMSLVNVMTYSLRSYEEGQHFITSSQIRDLQRDTVLLNLYLGLVYEQIKAKHIQFVHDEKAFNVAGIISRDVAGLKQYVMNISEQVKLMDTAVTILQQRKAAGETDFSANYAAVYGYARSILLAAGRTELINTSLALPAQYMEVLNFSSKALQVGHDIKVRNYNAVVMGVLSMLNDIIVKMPEGNDKEVAREFAVAFLKYGSFAANVVNAKNATEVKNAVEAVAMPSGSSRVKRMSAFNVALNGYVGPFVGYERSSGLDDNTTANTYGITAPIGVAISKGFVPSISGKRTSAVSLFISVIDLGAVTAFRFADAQTEEIPTIQLKNILAPGAFVAYGFGNTPLSLLLGAQVGPALRKVSVSGNDVADNMYYRFIASLAVDIPLFNFYTSPRKNFFAKHK